MRAKILAALVVLTVPVTASAAPARYTVVELGTFGGTMSFAHGIDDSGRIVGVSTNEHSLARAFKIDRPRALVASDMLPMPPGDGRHMPERSVAKGIAEDGTVAGFTVDNRGGEWSWLWKPDGSIVRGSNGTSAFHAISPTGDAVGYVYRWSNPASRMVKSPYLRRADGTTATLETYDGDSIAMDVAGNLVTGESKISTSATERVFIWRGGGATADDQGSFGGPGYKRTPTVSTTGRWTGLSGGVVFSAATPNVTPTELPRPAGIPYSNVQGQDSFDRLVGYLHPGGEGRSKAFYWHIGPTNIEMVDLRTRIPAEFSGQLLDARAINAEGVILINAANASGGGNRAVVLVPVKMTIAVPERVQTGNGATAEFVVSGCEPGAPVRLYKSAAAAAPGRGAGYRAMGIRWDLATPDTFGPDAVADASGVARIRVNMTVEPNRTLHLQAVHRGNKSTVVSITPTPAPLPIAGVKIPPGGLAPPGPQLTPQFTVPPLNPKK